MATKSQQRLSGDAPLVLGLGGASGVMRVRVGLPNTAPGASSAGVTVAMSIFVTELDASRDGDAVCVWRWGDARLLLDVDTGRAIAVLSDARVRAESKIGVKRHCWARLVVSITDSQLRLWVDGKDQGKGSVIPDRVWRVPLEPFIMGGDGESNPNNPLFKGLIADARVAFNAANESTVWGSAASMLRGLLYGSSETTTSYVPVAGPPNALRPPPYRCTRPFKRLKTLIRWRDLEADPLCRSSVPLPLAARASLPMRPRVLHCHDMKGGYLSDADAQGSIGAPQPDDRYAFEMWYLVDIFVYFSHARVTVPPKGWIEAGHRHGVRVLGTLITEWESGRRDNELLASKPEFWASKLASVAAYYGFDGWLVNIESPASRDAMLVFLKCLTRATRAAVGAHSQVIWYESLGRDGSVSYENKLTEKNVAFFNACDGIFTNYAWRSGDPVQSAAVAQGRRFDVYTGIDVFGRGTYGGGGHNTHRALAEIRRGGTSVALFAPAWTHEAFAEKGGRAACEANEAKFWLGWDFVDVSLDGGGVGNGTGGGARRTQDENASTGEWRILENGGQGWHIQTDKNGSTIWT